MPRIKLTETKQATPCRMYPSERAYIQGKYASISEAIRLLTKGGKYEQLIQQNEQLTASLKQLQG